jgi:putative N6-adenine-specific DNA methylase
LTGWTPAEPLLDPMCGSGTFLIEAAQIALGVAPGGQRAFGFECLENYDATLWAKVRAAAQGVPGPETPLRISGSDRDPAAIAAARRNLDNAGVAGQVALAAADVTVISAPADHGVIVMNPPYGVRLGQDDGVLAAFYPRLGDALKKNFAGWRAYIFTGDLRLPKLIGLAPSRRTPLFNGAIECRLYEFRLVSGSMRKK